MNFKAYGFNIKTQDYALILKMMRLVTDEKVEVYDLKSFEVDSTEEDVLFLYGKRAAQACESATCFAQIEFPEPSKLSASTDNTEERMEAHKKLMSFKEFLQKGETGKTYETIRKTVSSLPPLSAGEIRSIEAEIRETGVQSWTCQAEDGRSVRLTLSPEESEADINLTFRELYTMRILTDMFKITEFEIEYRGSNDGGKSSG